MDSRLQRKNTLIAEDNGSKHSIFKSNNNSDDIFSTKHLKIPLSKDYKVYDRNTMIAMFEKELLIPKSRKYSLLRNIKAHTVERQMDTMEVKIKKKRKRLDVKKIQEVKKKDSKSMIVVRKISSGDEELFYKARTRLQQNYEQIKRILHDHDESFAYLEGHLDRSDFVVRQSAINMPTLKSAKIPAIDLLKTIRPMSHSRRRVFMEDIAAETNGSLTNDLYDYTKAPQTERQILDLARDRASWADRRSVTVRTSGSSGQRISITGEQHTSHIPSVASNTESRMISITPPPQMQGSTMLQMFDTTGIKQSHASTAMQSSSMVGKIKASGEENDGMFFPGTDDDMKGISIVSRKTIQYMNSKNVAKNDSQSGLKKNMDSYIWYLIDPVVKRKYDLFLQKSRTAPSYRPDSK